MLERASLYVSSKLLQHNLQQVRDLAPGKEVIGMVKADGYGHGAINVARTLIESGTKILGVATLSEALELRRSLFDQRFEIFIFSDTQLEDEKNHALYSDFKLTPIISSREDLNLFLSQNVFKNFPLLIKFNTGMNRLGIPYADVDEVGKQILQAGRKSIDHVMSHFACASQSMNIANNKRQKERFASVLAQLRGQGLSIEATSLANSGAIEQASGLEYSHIRPGLMLYGPSSLIPGLISPWRGKIVSSLRTRVLKSVALRQGDPVGYGATPIARDGTLVIVALGYGDGFNNRYQKAKFAVKTQAGEKIPVDVVGRVNMDMVQLLAPPECKIKKGDEIIFWDDDPHGLEQLCLSASIIPYEVFCQLSVRVPRIFS